MGLTEEEEILKAKLLGSPLLFTQVFYELRTGRQFLLAKPVARPNLHEVIFRELLLSVKGIGDVINIIINMPPRYGKSEIIIHIIAWCFANFPYSQFLYASYGISLAMKQTKIIRDIMSLPLYKKLFGVVIPYHSKAKGDFETTAGGCVYAAGKDGPITGRGAGLLGATTFAGAFVVDDLIKPADAHSDAVRESTIEWIMETADSRVNDRKTPFWWVSQRVSEDDPYSLIIADPKYKKIILPALDGAGNPLNLVKHTKEELLNKKEKSPYVFAAQYQQDPQPAGGSIFREDDFICLEQEPEILVSFITVDTAATEKTYNDKTVFSFWGVYEIREFGHDLGFLGLHWIDCRVLNIEPKDLENETILFISDAMRHKCPVRKVCIEKQSTGVTLLSTLRGMRGVEVLGINRTRASGSKTHRFLDEMQPFIARKLVTLPLYGKHTKMCIEHMVKITPNGSHAFDDICDTAYDAVKATFIDKQFDIFLDKGRRKEDEMLRNYYARQDHTDQLIRNSYERLG